MQTLVFILLLIHSTVSFAQEREQVRAELLIAQTEQRAIAQLKKLLKQHQGSELEPGLWLRLAELYMRQSKTSQFFEIYRESESQSSQAPVLIKQASRSKSIRDALEIYERIEKRFPNFDQLDVVLFNHGFALQQVVQDDYALRLYQRMVREFPQSELMPDALLAIGEIAFKQKKFDLALDYFLRIKNYPESRVYPYGLYKTAWTYYNLNDARTALKELESVVAYGRVAAEQGLDSRLDLRREALFDMTLFFGDVVEPTAAYSYFKKQAGDMPVDDYLLRLGRLYGSYSKYVERELVLREFIKREPLAPRIPQAWDDLVWTLEAVKKRDLAVVELKLYAHVCNSKSDWSQLYPLPKLLPGAKLPEYDDNGTEITYCHKLLEGTALKLADQWLKLWEKNQKAEAATSVADAALGAFRVYLDFKGEGLASNTPRFAYADLLFRRDQFRTSAHEYHIVGLYEIDPVRGHDARYAAIVALNRAVGDAWSDADEALLRKYSEHYLAQHQKGKYRLDVEFKLALIAYDKNRFDEAQPVFVRLGREFSHTDKGQKAQDLNLDILNSRKDYAGIKAYAGELIKASKKPERVAMLTQNYEEAYFLEAQVLQEQGQKAQAAQHFREFATENHKSKLAPKAWWNAMDLFYQLGQMSTGAEMGLQYARKFPDEPRVNEALLRSAQSFESTADLASAVPVLEQLAGRDASQQLQWWLLASEFSWLTGQGDHAQKLLEKVVVATQDPLKKLPHLWRLREMALAQNQLARAQKWQQQIEQLGRDPWLGRIELDGLIAMSKDPTQPPSAVFKKAKTIVGRSSSVEPKVAAQARLIQAQILFDELKSQSLKTNVDRLAAVLALKTERLEKVQAALQAVIRLGHAETSVAALELLATAFAQYAADLKAMPAPQGLGDADLPVFRNELQSLILPMEEKAVDTLVQARDQAQSLDIYNGKARELQEKIDQMNLVNSERLQLTPVTDAAIMLPEIGKEII